MGRLMTVIVRDEGWSVEVYTREHPPAHVHVKKGGCEVKVSLPDDAPAGVVWVRGGTDRDGVRAVRIVERHVDALWAAWRRIHG